MNNWFDIVSRGCDVQRFHTSKLLHSESVGEHSFRCALFADYLHRKITMRHSYNVVMYMLLHDLPECDMGDMPHGAKKSSGMREALDQFEQTWCYENLPSNSQYQKIMYHSVLTDTESIICFYVDQYDACFKFIREYNLGNRNVYNNIFSCIDVMNSVAGDNPVLNNETRKLQETINGA